MCAEAAATPEGAAAAAEATAKTADAAPEPAPAKPAQRRLWLSGSLARSPGAFGFFRTAHAEPLGDRLRLLLDYNLPDGIPPIEGAEPATAGVSRRSNGAQPQRSGEWCLSSTHRLQDHDVVTCSM